MAKNDRDICPISKKETRKLNRPQKAIQSDPSHFRGEVASDVNMLRCVLYEMFMLASALQFLKMAEWPAKTVYEHPTLGRFDPSEVVKRSASISFRILYDFFYNPESGDDFQLGDFESFGVTQDDFQKPPFDGFEDGVAFTKDSINKFIAHLTWTRINKSVSIPQPKFKRGTTAIIENGLLLLKDAERFLDLIQDPTKGKPFPSLEGDSAAGYQEMFGRVMVGLRP